MIPGLQRLDKRTDKHLTRVTVAHARPVRSASAVGRAGPAYLGSLLRSPARVIRDLSKGRHCSCPSSPAGAARASCAISRSVAWPPAARSGETDEQRSRVRGQEAEVDRVAQRCL
eukprot:8553391-Pyramimonas_sp.AAC.1